MRRRRRGILSPYAAKTLELIAEGPLPAGFDRSRQAAAQLELARKHLDRTLTRGNRNPLASLIRRASPTTKVKGMSHSDLPSELGSYADGVTDDAAFHPEIIGCALDGISGGVQHLSVAGGLGSLAVAGIPSYLLSRKGLSNPTVRRRIAENIKAMTPKMRRRVLGRLRAAVAVARVSGAVRGAYPSIAGNVGWSGVMVSGARGGCPYANVAGALTP